MSEQLTRPPNLFYRFMRMFCRVFGVAFFCVRCFDRRNIPAGGGVLLASNHQSFLDPMLIALGLGREVNFLARDSLFRNPAFSLLISSVNTFPVKRGSADLAAIRECLRRLKGGEILALFGEGTRSQDGSIAPVQPGTMMLARKARVPVVPVVIDGAFEAWPRNRKLFRCCPIRVSYGSPITVEQIKALGDKASAAMLYQRQQQMQHRLRSRYGRKPFDYPLAGGQK